MSGKASLPQPVAARRPRRPRVHVLLLCVAAAGVTFLTSSSLLYANDQPGRAQNVPSNAQAILAKCAALNMLPGPPANFHAREESDRYEQGIPSTHIRNATIWTGGKNGTEVVYGDVLLDRGVVKAVGYVPRTILDQMKDVTVVDADGAWVTPGLIDFHSHIGIYSLPSLAGTFSLNSFQGDVHPWLRSVDAFDNHDESLRLAIAGGITSMQTLPGSATAVAGQSFMLKLRTTKERSPFSMVIEPPYGLNGTKGDPSTPPRWRHLKQAVGENLDAWGTRMDNSWDFRAAYDEARKIKNAQDAYCMKAQAGLWNNLASDFPENLKWEALVDVLRGKVKLSQHVYAAVDIDTIVRLSNEFQFRVDSFHHAAEAYLVPEVLNKTWGGTPAIALFANNYRYKREAYRGSAYAPRILSDYGFPVIMKTDHPAMNGRYLLFEAQQAHYYGLAAEFALASITTVPAKAAGLDHRIGMVREGADADIVMWDSHPLRLGAAPVRVWIDGAPQAVGAETGIVVGKGKEAPEWREVPETPDWKKERRETVKWEGLPPLEVESVRGRVVFSNVSEVLIKNKGEIATVLGRGVHQHSGSMGEGVVVIDDGKMVCTGDASSCSSFLGRAERTVDLQGGSLAPAFISFGSELGLEEITYEYSTGDGPVYDAFVTDLPKILGDVGGVVRASDALSFQSRNALLAHRAGVTVATTYPHAIFTSNTITGLSATFRTGSPHALADGAIIQRISALHYNVHHPPFSPVGSGTQSPSVSTRIAVLRRLLLEDSDKDETSRWFGRAAEGQVPLVVDVSAADAMASLLDLKREVEGKRGTRMRVVFSGATEAHLLAKEIGKAGVGVILAPARPMPLNWDDRRLLPGPPLSNDTSIVTLLENNVLVGLGTVEPGFAANTRFDVGWAAAESNGRISPEQALALGSVNLERLLGIDQALEANGDMVAYVGGGPLDMGSKVVGVVSGGRGVVDLV
ncbi:composite domain of metallo-dependent hydrolase [Artomyces pyxidatus]|uniref:Composite domain of metallo-dependent hydrolase n=1 Tax=Artomyces pyxidatus TaxID=48021 RepID=A0ACB8TAQ1_9AGAM|nr:composite domain of metallo-dependent hydrolase [Artomyces pyxidatus]